MGVAVIEDIVMAVGFDCLERIKFIMEVSGRLALSCMYTVGFVGLEWISAEFISARLDLSHRFKSMSGNQPRLRL
jgi:hypothetical protein